MPSTKQQTLEITVPEPWARTPSGLTRDGVQALDFDAGITADGRVYIGGWWVPEPEEWQASWPEWVLVSMMQDGIDLNGADAAVFGLLLEDLDAARPSPSLLEVG